jgi:hypothetical protein
MDNQGLLFFIPVIYAAYVLWVIQNGEYTTKHEVNSWVNIFGSAEYESETIYREYSPQRFWFKVSLDILIIVVIVSVLVALVFFSSDHHKPAQQTDTKELILPER